MPRRRTRRIAAFYATFVALVALAGTTKASGLTAHESGRAYAQQVSGDNGVADTAHSGLFAS